MFFLVLTMCTLVGGHRRFGGAPASIFTVEVIEVRMWAGCSLQTGWISSTLESKTARSFETSIVADKDTWGHNPRAHNMKIHRCENPKTSSTDLSVWPLKGPASWLSLNAEKAQFSDSEHTTLNTSAVSNEQEKWWIREGQNGKNQVYTRGRENSQEMARFRLWRKWGHGPKQKRSPSYNCILCRCI